MYPISHTRNSAKFLKIKSFCLPGPGFEPGSPRRQSSTLTTRPRGLLVEHGKKVIHKPPWPPKKDFQKVIPDFYIFGYKFSDPIPEFWNSNIKIFLLDRDSNPATPARVRRSIHSTTWALMKIVGKKHNLSWFRLMTCILAVFQPILMIFASNWGFLRSPSSMVAAKIKYL